MRELSAEESVGLWRSVRLLLHRHAPAGMSGQVRSHYTLLRQAIQAGVYDQAEGEAQLHPLMQHIHIALLATQELFLDWDSVSALLLFPVAEAGLITEREAEKLFGADAQRLLGLLRRTASLYLRRESISSENFHRLLISMAEDIRVVLLIIADRLYRLRNARQLYDEAGAKALAEEVSFLYAPIAHRLGLYSVKGEMEDLSLKYRVPQTFSLIKRKLGETKESRDAYIARFLAPLHTELEQCMQYPYEMKGRVKSISSIHNKMRKQSFEDIYDLFAIRIIIDAPEHLERQLCWQVYSIVTDMYQPNPERLKDWISIPKSNGYESLHITVLGPDSKWVEVQIRTKRMDAIAEQGVAAHWKYKGIKGEKGLDEFLSGVRDTLESLKIQGDGAEITQPIERSLMTLQSEEIYVFTPKGEVIKLPRGATLLDFAFSIHSRVGAQAISGKVNGKNVSLRYQLSNGDAVEVVTSPQQTPKQDWLSIVVSTRARNRIRQLLRSEEEAGIAVAKELIQRRVKNRKIAWDESLFIRLTLRKGYKTLTEFYKAIAQDRLDAQLFMDEYEQAQERLQEERSEQSSAQGVQSTDGFVINLDEDELQGRTIRSSDILVIDQGLSGVEYHFAKCCLPVYGDQIFGFVSGRGIKVHRIDCPNARDLIERSPHRVFSAQWSGIQGGEQMIHVDVIGRDDISVITNVLSLIKKEESIKLRGYSLDSSDGLFRASFLLHVVGGKSITALLKKVRNVVGVKQVKRL